MAAKHEYVWLRFSKLRHVLVCCGLFFACFLVLLCSGCTNATTDGDSHRPTICYYDSYSELVSICSSNSKLILLDESTLKSLSPYMPVAFMVEGHEFSVLGNVASLEPLGYKTTYQYSDDTNNAIRAISFGVDYRRKSLDLDDALLGSALPLSSSFLLKDNYRGHEVFLSFKTVGETSSTLGGASNDAFLYQISTWFYQDGCCWFCDWEFLATDESSVKSEMLLSVSEVQVELGESRTLLDAALDKLGAEPSEKVSFSGAESCVASSLSAERIEVGNL